MSSDLEIAADVSLEGGGCVVHVASADVVEPMIYELRIASTSPLHDATH